MEDCQYDVQSDADTKDFDHKALLNCNQCSCFRYDEMGVKGDNRKIKSAAEFIIR